MKTQTLLMIAGITISLLIFSQCKPSKSLLYKEDGNYLVTNNYLIKDMKRIDSRDIGTLRDHP